MAKEKKLTREEQLMKKREAEKARYRRIKNDPQKLAEQKQKEKLKYLKKKEQGEVKAVKDMTPREKRLVRKQRRGNVAAFRKRKAALKDVTNKITRENTPPPSDNDKRPVNQNRVDRRKISGKKKSERARKLRNKMLKQNETEINKFKKKLDKLKKRLRRVKRCEVGKNLTPNTKVNQMLADPSPGSREKITKNLLFGEVMKQQLHDNFSTLSTPKEKAIFTRAVTGNLTRRYKVLREIGSIPKKRRLQSTYSGSFLEYERRPRKNVIPNHIKESVVQFLEEDCNSRLCAGKKESLTRNKEKKQKRILSDTMKNLHKKYLSSQDVTLSYSIFCKLRPFWISQPRCSDRDTCLCVTHANLDLLLQSLNQSNIISISNHQTLLETLCCNRYNETCLGRACRSCMARRIEYKEFDDSTPINLKQWEIISETIIDSKSKNPRKVKKYTKKITQLPLSDVIDKLENSLAKFFQHQLNIVHQYNEIKTLRNKITQEDCIIHMDFSENYNAKYSEEIQAFHFGGSRSQYSLHTVVMYTRNAEDSISTTCVCTLSSNLAHNPAAIWAHLKPIFKLIPERVVNIHFLSDGLVTQYRNKTMFFMLACQLQEFYPEIKRFTWNYHEAGHGKGAPDGVGAVYKRTANKFVSLGRDVSSLDSLASIIEENCPGIRTFVITNNDIEEVASVLDAHSKMIVPFTGTLRVHQVCGNIFLPNKLNMKALSCFCTEESCTHYKLGELKYSTVVCKALTVDDIYSDSESENESTAVAGCSEVNTKKNVYSPGDFILVKLSAKKSEYSYAAICSEEIDEDEGEIKVTFLKLCNDDGTLFKVNDTDISFVPLDQIICSLPIPTMISRGNRYFYKFPTSVDVFEK